LTLCGVNSEEEETHVPEKGCCRGIEALCTAPNNPMSWEIAEIGGPHSGSLFPNT
jgi:hypothetical protein